MSPVPNSAVRSEWPDRTAVCGEEQTRFLTVFRTLLKYMKLTATAMIWRRMAARVMSPRLPREAELAIAQRGDGTQMSPEQQENTSRGRTSQFRLCCIISSRGRRGGSGEREGKGGREGSREGGRCGGTAGE